MKKKLLAVVLCIAMLFTFSASGALAEEIGTNGTQENVGVIDEQNDAAGQDQSDQTDLTEGSLPDGSDPSSSSGEESAEIEEGTAAGGDSEEGQTPENGENSSDPASEQNPSAEAGDASDVSDPQDYASMTAEELYAYIMQLGTDEEKEAVLAALPQEKIDALVAYAQEQEAANYVPPETVVFTDAGPFMPPVSVVVEQKITAAMKKLFNSIDTGATYALDNAITTFATADNGLELSKVATANADGSYTIRMEAYTTGTVTTSTKTVPVDIVLVLDQSGSMAYDFNGNETKTNTARRQYAMKQAVNNFIGSVAEKYTNEADHRIGIVTFNSDAYIKNGLTLVDNEGLLNLKSTISNLPDEPSGGTQTGSGVALAKSMMIDNYQYHGNNTERQKVVIVFTDGVPGQSGFDTSVADDAIFNAKNLKDNKVTVYSVGIFNGANPAELYGSSGFDTNSDGKVYSKWVKDTWGFFPGTDFPEADRPAGNRFLNYLSSNFPDAESIGLERATRGLGILHYKITYTIMQNFSRSKSGYYLTADNSASLNKIFKTISDNIQTPNINLGSDAVIKDTVSKYFDLPESAKYIKLYTAAAKEDGSFVDAVPADGVTATIKNNAVFVTGFDFNANFVSDKLKEDNTYGKKLIIEFDVTPKDEFIGGNDVPTNEWENTAVYDKNGMEEGKFAGEDTTPRVNVPIKDITVTAHDKNVYLLGNLTGEQLRNEATVKVGNVELNLGANVTNYGLESWQTDYVDITVEIKNAGGETITELTDLQDDTTYAVSVTVAPKHKGENAAGTPVAKMTKANEPYAKINVFKPELTYEDSEVYYGDIAPASFTENKTSEVWKHNETASTDNGVDMIGEKPELCITYILENGKIADRKINTKQDVPVNVTVKIGDSDVTHKTAFDHTACTGKCGWNETSLDGSPAFLLHVKTCQLTIKKEGVKEEQPFVFNVYKKDKNGNYQKYSEVTVNQNDKYSQTLYELPVGTYKIQEDSKWSWRYDSEPTYKYNETNKYNELQLSAGENTDHGTITCTNTSTNSKWLNGFSAVVQNVFVKPKTVH